MKRASSLESYLPNLKAHFITDAKGNKKQVVLELDQFEELLETLEDYYDIVHAAVAKRKNEKTKSLDAVKKRLLK
jgi:hypothetical protein